MVERDLLFRRRIVFEKLIPYGFVKHDSMYEYSTPILDGDFQLSAGEEIDG